MPYGRPAQPDPLFTVTMFGLLVAACIMAAAVAAQQPQRQATQCGRCGQPLPATCPECGQRLPPEKPEAVPQQPKPQPKPEPQSEQDEDGWDIVAPMIFAF